MNIYESAILTDYKETHIYVHQKIYTRKFIATLCHTQILKLTHTSIDSQVDNNNEIFYTYENEHYMRQQIFEKQADLWEKEVKYLQFHPVEFYCIKFTKGQANLSF